jgi:hypothetical protein
MTSKNKTPIKIFVNRYSNTSIKDFDNFNMNKTNESKYNNFKAKSNIHYFIKKKINTNTKNNILS